jgi:hypothetical protein
MASTGIVRAGAVVAVCCAAVLGAAACRPDASGQAVDRAPTRPGASESPTSSGLAALSGKQIADRSLAAMRRLHSLTVRADITDRDGRTRGTVTVAANGCRIHATTPGMGTVTYIRTGEATVVRLDEDAVRAVAGRFGAKLLAGKYLKIGDDPSFADMASMCRARYFTDELTRESSGVSFTKAGTATVSGVPAVVLTVKGRGDSSRLYVAASGKPYLLKATVHLRKYSGTATFSDFDRVPSVHLPPAGRTIDISRPHG